MRLCLFTISSHPAAWFSQWNLRLCYVLFYSIGSGSYQAGRDFEFGDVHLVYSRRSSGAFVATGMTANGCYRRTLSSFAWYRVPSTLSPQGFRRAGRDAMVDMFNPEFDSRTEDAMADMVTVELQSGTEVAEEAQVPAVSWAAIVAGGVASAALTLVLLAFGAGIGLSAISPWANSGISSTTFNFGAGVYLCIIAVMASSIGGYLAGRLRTKWVGVHTHEVYFRDTAHGFLAWAFATVLSVAVLASAAANIVSGAAVGFTQAIGSAGGQSAGPMAGFVDLLLRANPPITRSDAGDVATARGELDRLFTSHLSTGEEFSPADRTYLAQVVAALTGVNQPEAENRVSQVIAQAKSAVDSARKAGARFALWLTASLLLGAFSASLAATEGGGLRDGTWKY